MSKKGIPFSEWKYKQTKKQTNVRSRKVESLKNTKQLEKMQLEKH